MLLRKNSLKISRKADQETYQKFSKRTAQRTAFSLLEISIVLVIISILTTIIISSTTLLKLAHLNSARNITKSAVARDISGMILWLDAVSAASFDDEFIEDGDEVTNWNDIKSSHLEPYVATQATAINKPIYHDNILNKLPAVTFDGVNDFLSIANFQANGYLTVFVVGQFVPAASFFIEQSSDASSSNGFYFNGNGNAPTTVSRSSDSTNINNSGWFGERLGVAVMRYNGTNISYKLNNGAFINSADPDATNNIVIDDLFIGARNGTSNFTNGNFGEIIIYDRALTDNEVDKVVTYLDQKWDIY